MTKLHKLLVRGTALTVLAGVSVAIPTVPPMVSVAQAQAGPTSVADLADRLLISVVNISTSQSTRDPAVRRPAPRPEGPDGSPFQEFFEEFFDEDRGGPPRNPNSRQVSSLGSGFVLDAEEGIIVTNNHVIADADEITVNFADGDSLSAEIVGRDPKTDIAVLKVDPSEKELVAVPFGDSEAARIGDWVLAIGNPFGLGGSVSIGIISAQNRNINAGPYDRFIQTDAAINRGNSGGPLFNMDGEVIGINTAIISPSGGSIGIGFSIPSELALGVVEQLREFGETRRGYLGIRIQPVTDEIAESLGLDEAAGVLVSGIIPGGPAEGGALEAGDVILTFNGREVNEPRELSRTVAETAVGRDVEVEVLRDGERQTISITLGRLEDGERALAAAEEEEAQDENLATVEIFGMALSEIDDDLRATFEIAEDVTGVVITEVDEGGAAAERGLTPGMVVVEVAQETVVTPEEMVEKIEELKELGRKNALLMVSMPGGELSFVTIRID